MNNQLTYRCFLFAGVLAAAAGVVACAANVTVSPQHTTTKSEVAIAPESDIAADAMQKAYTSLRSFSCVMYSRTVHNGIANGLKSSRRQSVAHLHWKPGIVSISTRSYWTTLAKWQQSNAVYDGRTVKMWSSFSPNEYSKLATRDSRTGILSAFEGQVSGLKFLSAPQLIFADVPYPPSLQGIWPLKSGIINGTVVKRWSFRFKDEEGYSHLVISLDEGHLLRQHQLFYYNQDGSNGVETETYTNIRINPVIADKVFRFVPPRNAKLNNDFRTLITE